LLYFYNTIFTFFLHVASSTTPIWMANALFLALPKDLLSPIVR